MVLSLESYGVLFLEALDQAALNWIGGFTFGIQQRSMDVNRRRFLYTHLLFLPHQAVAFLLSVVI